MLCLLDLVSMLGNLSPVRHESNPFLYRVPLKREGENYILYVADNFVRNFTSDTLPDEVKTKFTMISAASKTSMHDWEVFNTHIYIPRFMIEGFGEIGWQVSDSYFCICLTKETLDDMRGEI